MTQEAKARIHYALKWQPAIWLIVFVLCRDFIGTRIWSNFAPALAVPRSFVDKKFAEDLTVNFKTISKWTTWSPSSGTCYWNAIPPVPVKITTSRPFMKRRQCEQEWIFSPVDAQTLRVQWKGSSRWDGKTEWPQFDRTITLQELKKLNGGKGIRVWEFGDNPTSLSFTSVWVRWPFPSYSNAGYHAHTQFNSWEEQVRARNLGKLVNGGVSYIRPPF